MTAPVILGLRPHPAEGDVEVLTAAGELDHSNAERLRGDFLRLLETHAPRALVLDLSGLTFCDSSGVRVLLAMRTRVQEAGGVLALAGLNRRLVRIFETTGLMHAFLVHETADEAARAVRSSSRHPGP
ncbi:anti-sigma B factor antagonist [Thermocatellispora tengchongensis]|uniref:Anti-sigma factor antagonist n=1 Tax=Thermocatellispora tengchongensis TaxID=1073253 RepID=A0A840PSX6_9ACTN|nr:STAS domain-containing protein [Thermocatellispora tengchongensis]MBB5139045.1 anti-sigma B factor antagonist [Thermocatellispora tengchongensis]